MVAPYVSGYVPLDVGKDVEVAEALDNLAGSFSMPVFVVMASFAIRTLVRQVHTTAPYRSRTPTTLRLSCLKDSCSIRSLGSTSTLHRYSNPRPSLTMTFTLAISYAPPGRDPMICGVRLSEARQT